MHASVQVVGVPHVPFVPQVSTWVSLAHAVVVGLHTPVQPPSSHA
jgi:hypothetical protein